MKDNLPEKIFLRCGKDIFGEPHTWQWHGLHCTPSLCGDVDDGDIPYVRKDVAEQMAKDFAKISRQELMYVNQSTIDELFKEFINSRKAINE